MGSASGRRFSGRTSPGDSPARSCAASRVGVLGVERSAVVALDGRHRGEVAGSQAFERTQVELSVRARATDRGAGRLATSRRARRARHAAGRRGSCTRRSCGGPPGAARTCRRSSRPTRGRPASRASPPPPAPSPRGTASRAPPVQRPTPGGPPSGSPGTATCDARSSRAAPSGTWTSAGSGTSAGPASTRAPSQTWAARRSREPGVPRRWSNLLIGRCRPRIGSSIARFVTMSAM